MIYITGCAKSGTTLLRRMFYAFERCGVINEEIDLDAFITMGQKEDLQDAILVGKRTVSTVFSNIMFPKLMQYQLDLIKENNIQVVNIIRDGRDAVLNGWISCDRWVESLKQAEKYKGYITATVYFEDLIRKPDEVQNMLAQKLNIKPHAKFSDYPAFMQDEDAASGHYKKYKLSEKKILQDPERYKKFCPGLQGDFDEFLKRHGYL
jgi:nicotinamide mononucleotide adenylyltransferase